MKYITVIDEEMLQYFRVDDDGKEKVLVANGRGFLLRPLPQRKKNSIFHQGEVNIDIPIDFLEKIHNQGYNACIDEIMGETE